MIISDRLTNQLNDNDVVRRVISREKELFEILMRRHNQTLYRVVRGYLRDEDEVRDAMQNAYLKAFDKLCRFNGRRRSPRGSFVSGSTKYCSD